MTSPNEVVYDQSFPPEMADERVAWIGIYQNTPEYTQVSVAMGFVGVKGAEYKIEKAHGIDGLLERNNGFLDPLGVRLAIENDSGSILDSQVFASSEMNTARQPERIYLSDFAWEPAPTVKHGRWLTGREAIVDGIKETLDERELGWVYPALYYGIFSGSSPDKLFADPSMRDVTTQEITNVGEVVRLLAASSQTDVEMRRNLTVFGAIPASEISTVFTESRRGVAGNEQAIAAEMRDSHLKYRILPVGNRTSGRSWPYMDPTEPDEAKAFGPELEALQNGLTSRATKELEREIKELTGRTIWTEKLLRKLNSLASQEAALVEIEASFRY